MQLVFNWRMPSICKLLLVDRVERRITNAEVWEFRSVARPGFVWLVAFEANLQWLAHMKWFPSSFVLAHRYFPARVFGVLSYIRVRCAHSNFVQSQLEVYVKIQFGFILNDPVHHFPRLLGGGSLFVYFRLCNCLVDVIPTHLFVNKNCERRVLLVWWLFRLLGNQHWRRSEWVRAERVCCYCNGCSRSRSRFKHPGRRFVNGWYRCRVRQA